MTSATIPPWDTLPVEALEAVFRYLNRPQLACLRLMCRHWNSAICHSPVLMKKFVAIFRADSVFGTANLEEQSAMAAQVTARFSVVKAELEAIQHMVGNPLWARIGLTVRSFHVFDAGEDGSDRILSVSKLLAVLREMPNLVSLSVKVPKLVAYFDAEIDLELNRVETLTVGLDDASCIEVFQAMCSKLKEFEFDGEISPKNRLQSIEVLPIIHANKETLRKITIKGIVLNCDSFQELSTVSGIQLKSLSLEGRNLRRNNEFRHVRPDDILRLCTVFPMIECLKIEIDYMYSWVLEKLRTSLKHLRALSIRLNSPDDGDYLMLFMQQAPQLEKLRVVFESMNEDFFSGLNLRKAYCPNLKELELENFIFTQNGLADFVRQSPNMTSVYFTDFELNNANMVDVLQALSHLKSLKVLEIDYLDLGKYRDYYDVVLESVRTLRTTLISLDACCPNVESIDVLSDAVVTDKDIIGMLERHPNLRELSVRADYKQNLSDVILDYLAAHGRRLESVNLTLKASRTTTAARNRLKETLKNWATVDYTLK